MNKVMSWGVLILILGIVVTMVVPLFQKEVVIVTEDELLPVGKNEAGLSTFMLYRKGDTKGGTTGQIALAGVAGLFTLIGKIWGKK